MSHPADISGVRIRNFSMLMLKENVAPKGRRLRMFPTLYHDLLTKVFTPDYVTPDSPDIELTVGQAYLNAMENQEQRDALSALPLRVINPLYQRSSSSSTLSEIPTNLSVDEIKRMRDPELHRALQDLAYTLGMELTLACEAFDDPDVWYPGVYEGIEPLDDDHVRLVIWGAQRELYRELRPTRWAGPPRPAAPLDQLPFRVQRAYAERRRWHYLQYGIGRTEFETNRWSFWNVNEDPDWSPTWSPTPRTVR